jgi:excinuclease ABC subunit B
MNIIRDLRIGVFDVLIGINLLREGLDIPEVSLVGILDADKEGFLRSARSLIQTIGRAARNANGRVILYADKRTDSIEAALEETDRRREIQAAYNIEHDITPRTITKRISDLEEHVPESDESEFDESRSVLRTGSPEEIENMIEELRIEMKAAAKALKFEVAAQYRDEVRRLQAMRDAIAVEKK